MPRPKQRRSAGRLDQRVQLWQPTLAQGALGGTSIDSATLLYETWAAVKATEGHEAFVNQEVVSQVTYDVTVDWSPCLNATLLVRWCDRTFQIQAVQNQDGFPGHLVSLRCIERDDSSREQQAQAGGVPRT